MDAKIMISMSPDEAKELYAAFGKGHGALYGDPAFVKLYDLLEDLLKETP
jgi:hypothetical protein